MLAISLRVSGLSLSIALVILVAYILFKQQIPPSDWLAMVLFIGLGLPAVFLALIVPLIGVALEWKRKILLRPPFNELDQLTFVAIPLFERNKWELIQELKVGKIKGFDVSCDVEDGRIQFTAPVEWKPIEFDRVQERFKQYNIELIAGGLVKYYDIRNPEVHTIEELRADLEEFIDLLKQEGLEPKKKLDWTNLC